MPLSKLFKDRLHYFDELPFAEAYSLFDTQVGVYQSPSIQVREILVPTPDFQIPVRVYQRDFKSHERVAIIWMHGGGFVNGSYTMNEGDIVSRELAFQGNCIVFNVEYRLVSESVKFPVPQNDCLAVLDWVYEKSSDLGVDRSQIFIGGVSAGGCLAASVAAIDRDRGTKYLAGQTLQCPMVHRQLPTASIELSRKVMELGKAAFSAETVSWLNSFAVNSKEDSENNPHWWPGDVTNFAGFPPTQIINCEYDSLRASGEKFAADLRAAGVEVESLTQKNVPHAHLNRVPDDCPEHQQTVDSILRFILKVSRR